MKWGMPVMTRSRFFFNSSMIRQNLRQHGWIGIIYTLGLLFALPLQMFMNSNPTAKPQNVKSLFFVGGEIQMMFAVTVPIAAGLFLFRYLQARMSSDLYHSLPLRREHLLTSQTVSGLILLMVPVWLTAAVAAIVRPLDGNMFIYSGAAVWKWALTLSILTLFLFIFSLFVGICTGQSILQGMVIVILLLLPVMMIKLINQHLGMYLFGYPEWYVIMTHIEVWSPILHMVYVKTNPFYAWHLWIYAALSVLFMGLSIVLYRKRHSEKAGQAIAFSYFNPLFKAGFMLCTMLISGIYFGELKQGQPGWVIGGYIAGALLGYIAAEMIIRKTWHILSRRAPVEFVLYSALLGLLLYIPVTSVTGYEGRVPDGDKVASVYAGSNYRMFTENMNVDGRPSSSLNREEAFTENKNYIEAVRKLHQAVVTTRPEGPSYDYYGFGDFRQMDLVYQLANGRIVHRAYMIPAKGFEPELREVMESEGYKRMEYMLSRLDTDIESIRMSYFNRAISISDPQDVKEFVDILKREYLNMSYDDQTSNRMSLASIQTMNKPDATGYQLYNGFDWKPSFHELETWLTQKGYGDKVRVKASDIISAEIIKNIYNDRVSPEDKYNIEVQMDLARSEKASAVTTDAGFISEILKNQRSFSGPQGEYLVKMVYKAEKRVDYVSLQEQDLTPALKALLP